MRWHTLSTKTVSSHCMLVVILKTQLGHSLDKEEVFTIDRFLKKSLLKITQKKTFNGENSIHLLVFILPLFSNAYMHINI